MENSSNQNLPRKFLTRIRKYRESFGEEFRQTIGLVKKNLTNKAIKSDEVLEPPIITEIKEKIDRSTNIEALSGSKDLIQESQIIHSNNFPKIEQFTTVDIKCNVYIKHRYFQRELGLSDEVYDFLVKSLLWYEIRFQIRRKMTYILLLTIMVIIIYQKRLLTQNKFIMDKNWKNSKSNQKLDIDLFINKFSLIKMPKNNKFITKILF